MGVEVMGVNPLEEQLYNLLSLHDAPLTVSALLARFPDRNAQQILRSLMKLRRRGRVLLKRHVLHPKREPEFIAVTKALLERHTINIGF